MVPMPISPQLRSFGESRFPRLLMLVVAGALLAGDQPTASAQRQLLDYNQAAQLGLTEAWRRQLTVTAGSASIVDQLFHVHGNLLHRYVEVVADAPAGAAAGTPASAEQGTASVSQPPPRAEPVVYSRQEFDVGGIDQAEAERLARNEIRRLTRRGIKATQRVRDVPVMRLYTLGTDGTVECRDAETGEPVWVATSGGARQRYIGLGVDDEFVTVINGGQLSRFDALTGGRMGTTPLMHTPVTGPIHLGGFAIVPCLGGRIEGYPLRDPSIDPFSQVVLGTALMRPVKAVDAETIVWGTDRGLVYALEMTRNPVVTFRLGTDGVVAGTVAAASKQRFFFGSSEGQVYGISALGGGEVIWNQPTGQPIEDGPVFLNEKVLVRTVYGNLMCLDAATGFDAWPQTVANIDRLFGVFDDRVYARTLSGSVVVLSLADGSMVARFPGLQPRRLLLNRFSDRLYLIDDNGTVQCLRGAESPLPTYFATSDAAVPGGDAAETEEKAEASPAKPAAPAADPFAPAADPFAAGAADPFAVPAGDPFAPAAGGNDPFAAPAGGDPFGF